MRWTGYLVDRYDDRDLRFDSARSRAPESASLLQFARVGLDQRNTSACVGFGVAQALWVRMGTLGIAQQLPSALAIYANARLRGGYGLDEDKGSRPRDAWETLRKLGWCPEQDWPFALTNIKRPPPWNAYRKGIDHRWLRYERIVSIGSSRAQDVKNAIASGRPVSLGFAIDDVFVDLAKKDVWQGPESPASVIGRHYVCAVGYDAHGVRIVNSWGTDWADGGVGTVSWLAVESAWICTDLYAPEVIP